MSENLPDSKNKWKESKEDPDAADDKFNGKPYDYKF